ncbi:hypothetical protein MM239_08955 [Belliella sp. DSM 111904]|uniref:Uncharacterized protein n=1 Tax=Belliella filtrata TaxID=2923435 RepID=A0ABS9UZC3_9BACT|nr:hypothetical protein [Belliella filtrata]MCH7409522.1 hypothetical protein [Belliella filtrata]
MITITALGFLLNYLSSKRIVIPSNIKLVSWSQDNPLKSRLIGISILIISLITHIYHLGVGSGSLSFILTLMLTGSLVILLSPLEIFGLKNLSLIFIISLSFETLL